MNRQRIEELVGRIEAACEAHGPMRLMEVCGTHTVNLFRSGVWSMLPSGLGLISGPGCPVCVTSQGWLDAACEAALLPGVTICTYGDMVCVPGRTGSLEQLRGRGADVMVVYSARDAVAHAQAHPDRTVVFLAVGFETTAPATAFAVMEADRNRIDNFFILAGHKLVVPALSALLSGGDSGAPGIDGLMCPGHVSVVIGAAAYECIAEQYHRPCVITGFEPQQMLVGIGHLVEQVRRGEAKVENVYGVAVAREPNAVARRWIDEVFAPAATVWRAIGEIPDSGLELRRKYHRFDAVRRLDLTIGPDHEPPGCLCGQVIQGKAHPAECPHFGKGCSPLGPIGPCMVSSEGTCAAWYKYGPGAKR